jgi:hypothetical protein
VNGGPDEILVDGGQISLPSEDDIGGILGLVDAPMIDNSKMFGDWTETTGKLVQFPVQTARFPGVGDLLSPFPIADLAEGVIHNLAGDPLALQLQGQPVVPVAVDLQPAGQPSGNSHVAKTKFLIHQIEVVMQAFALIGFQECFAAGLVMPRLECRARFHRRKNPDQAGLITALCQDFFDAVFFSKVFLTNVFDLDAMIGSQFLGVLPNLVPKRFGKARIVEDAHMALVQPRRHAFGVADLWKCSENQNAVVAG